MKRNFVKLLIATLALGTVALGADRTTGTFLQKATSGYYFFSSTTTYVYFQATTYQRPSGDKAAYLYVYASESNGSYMSASGWVPPSMLKASENSLVVNIPDLRDLAGPDFYFYEFNFVGPFAVNCQMTATSLWREENIGKYTQRVPQPDGTVTLSKTNSKSTRTSATVEGNIVGYTLPMSDPVWYSHSVELQTGDYKSHFVP